MVKIKVSGTRTLILCTILGISGVSMVPASASIGTPASQAKMAYKSCSYPPSKGPSTPRKPAAKSWTAQGFTPKKLRGIDISMWQHKNSSFTQDINFTKVAKAGVDFVIIKASDGGNRDKGKSQQWFALDSAAARRAGLIVGAYHYAVPGVMAKTRTKDAVAQAHMLVVNAGGNPIGDLPLVLDLEELPCGWSLEHLAKWAKTFVQQVEKETGRKPMIYANGVFLQRLEAVAIPGFDFTDYPLWLARWGKPLGTTPPASPLWGKDWTVWQFSSDGHIDGIPVARVDLSTFNGSMSQLRALTRH